MIEQWFSDPSKVGATVLLMTAVVMFYLGKIMTVAAHEKQMAANNEAWKLYVSRLEAENTREREEKQLFRAMVLDAIGMTKAANDTTATILETTKTRQG